MNRVLSICYWYDIGYKTAKKEAFDRVLEIVDDALKLECKAIKATANQIQIVKQLKDRILELKGWR